MVIISNFLMIAQSSHNRKHTAVLSQNNAESQEPVVTIDNCVLQDNRNARL